VTTQVLPPIGGLKGKRDSKMKTQTFKTAANVFASEKIRIRFLKKTYKTQIEILL